MLTGEGKSDSVVERQTKRRVGLAPKRIVNSKSQDGSKKKSDTDLFTALGTVE